MSLPRILPLVAVAVGGVLALKALSEADALPKMMAGARAFAEEAAPKGRGPAAKPVAKPADKPAAPTSPPLPAIAQPVAPAAPAVCAPSTLQLAKDAGLSPAELQVLQNLGTRRTQLDARERDLDTQLQLLAAAEAKLDAKLKGLNGLKAELTALLAQTDQKKSTEIDRLVIVYSKMKPRDAGAVMTQLADSVRIPVAAKMKEAALAAVLSQMPPSEAKKLTESLARRYDGVQQLAQAAAAPAATAAAPAADAEDDPAAGPAKATAPSRPARRPAASRAANAARAAAAKAKAEAAPAAGKPAAAPASDAPKPAA